MKKFTKLLAIFLCVLMFSQVLVACVKTPEGDGESETQTEAQEQTELQTETETEAQTESETQTETEPEIILGAPGTYTEVVEGADSKKMSLTGGSYKLIYNNKGSEFLRSEIVAELYSSLYDSTAVLFPMKADATTPESEQEIVIGDTNREVGMTSADFAYLDYGWKCIGKKVVIMGGSDEALELATNKFVELYVDAEGKTLEIPKDIEYRAYYSYPYSNITVEGTDISEFGVLSKKSIEKSAIAVVSGFGRLTGVVIPVTYVRDGADTPEGKFIRVGMDVTGSLDMSCKVENGTLNFVSNGETNDLDQLDKVIEKFFSQNFTVSDEVQRANITADASFVASVELEYLTAAPNGLVEELDSEFDARVEDILNSQAQWTLAEDGKIFYVSSSMGNDLNDGMTPETPWKTIDKVNNAAQLTRGCVVLFKRGDEWNREKLIFIEGVTYSAYGEGAKPMISKYAAANEVDDWIEVYPNIWVYNGEYASNIVSGYANDASIPGSYVTSLDMQNSSIVESDANNDVGTIVFRTADGREGWGIKVTKLANADYSLAIGDCYNGFDYVSRGRSPFVGGKDLKQNLEFFHDPKQSRVYLYWDKGNPAESFEDIKLVLRGYLGIGSAKDVTVDNIAFKYVGAHGISVGSSDNFTVRNCEFGWIGGSIQKYSWSGRDYHTRFGEGIQNWGNCDGFYIYDNYFYQVYDGATSSQFSRSASTYASSAIMKDVRIQGNAYEDNTGSFEFWISLLDRHENDPNFKFVDFDCSNNLIRDMGAGFGSGRNDKGANAFCSTASWPRPIMENCHIYNNKTWGSRAEIIAGSFFHTEYGYNVHDNLIVQEYDAVFAKFPVSFETFQTQEAVPYNYTDTVMADIIARKGVGDNQFYFTHELLD